MTRKSCVVLCLLPFCCTMTIAAPRSSPAAPAPPTTPSRLDEGGKKLAAGDTTGAISSLRDVVHADPGNAEAAHLLTIAYLHAGQMTQAMHTAEAEINLPTTGSEERARAALLLGTAGYSLLTDKIKDVNGRIESFASMKLLLQQMAPRQHMLPSENTVIDPGDDGLQSAGSALGSSVKADVDDLQKTLSKADAAFQLALSINPHLPGAHDGLGLIRAFQGYDGEARQEFLTEIAENGASGPAFLHLAEVDLLQHQDEQAVVNLRRAADLDPDIDTPYHDLAALYEKRKDNDRTQWARGMSAMKHGDLRGAEAAFARSSQMTGELLCAKAQLAFEQKRPADARALLAQARALDPSRAEIDTHLGELEASLAHYQEALVSYQHALEIDATSSAAWYGMGLVYDALDDRESAVSDYRQALQSNPNDPSARLHLADDEAELGQTVRSASDFSDYLRRFPTASNHYLVMTALARNQGH